MVLERRKDASKAKPQAIIDNTGGTSDRKKRKHRACLSYSRERVPTLFLICLAVLVFFDHEFIFKTTQSELESFEAWTNNNRDSPILGVSGQGDNTRSSNNNSNFKKIKRSGFMVLGMHRSGTSMLTGLLYMAGGYTFGGKLHQAKANPKGFFERFDVVGQNDKFLKSQGISWNKNVLNFDWEKALGDKESGDIPFNGGNRFFRFTRDEENVPWLQKDPRMCITLKLWLKLMDEEPAILFTYRHPLEVALSLEKRKLGNLDVTGGLKLWIAYNMRAIQNSRGLCIVRTSNRAVIADPLAELQRISDELTSKCGVTTPPHPVKQEEIVKFIDPNLQHYDASNKADRKILQTYNNKSCVAYTFESKHEEGSRRYNEEQLTYVRAMRIYCDLESGKAYEADYKWPTN